MNVGDMVFLRISPTSVGVHNVFYVSQVRVVTMSAQSEGNYAKALHNYYEATRPEIDPYDQSYILYNIGLIHTSNGEHTKALEYYFRALERNPFLPQAFNNMAVICHYVRLSPL
ncbi:putative photosystem I assembly protein Ycf3-like [Iris pallida]|uniref:Photosystem I assembly protein Ycf3-like n=1 Tax=Iris pallida TaxID=29817 RepID=A0AAX6GUG6_IRIPA|nr:putative photosystem I assembly protein Ycf3-like [Iris pallida]